MEMLTEKRSFARTSIKLHRSITGGHEETIDEWGPSLGRVTNED